MAFYFIGNVESKTLDVRMGEMNKFLAAKPENIKTVAIFGKWRGGKSALMNMLAYNLNPTAIPPFAPNADNAKGIYAAPMSLAKTQNYVLLDCEGAVSVADELDARYALSLYTLADIIIYNQHKELDTGVWTALAPLISIVTTMKKNKLIAPPVLIFRLADYGKKGAIRQTEVNKRLADFLLPRTDRFSAASAHIGAAFSSISICATKAPSEKMAALIDKYDFATVMATENCNFRETIDTMRAVLDNTKGCGVTIYRSIIGMVRKNTEKIVSEWSTDQLDSYEEEMRQEIRDFVVAIDKAYYSEPHTTGHTSDIDIIYKRDLAINEMGRNFDKQFTHIPDFIKLPERASIFETLTNILESIKRASASAAKTAVAANELYRKHYQIYPPGAPFDPRHDIEAIFADIAGGSHMAAAANLRAQAITRWISDTTTAMDNFMRDDQYYRDLADADLTAMLAIDRIADPYATDDDIMDKAHERSYEAALEFLTAKMPHLHLLSICAANFLYADWQIPGLAETTVANIINPGDWEHENIMGLEIRRVDYLRDEHIDHYLECGFEIYEARLDERDAVDSIAAMRRASMMRLSTVLPLQVTNHKFLGIHVDPIALSTAHPDTRFATLKISGDIAYVYIADTQPQWLKMLIADIRRRICVDVEIEEIHPEEASYQLISAHYQLPITLSNFHDILRGICDSCDNLMGRENYVAELNWGKKLPYRALYGDLPDLA